MVISETFKRIKEEISITLFFVKQAFNLMSGIIRKSICDAIRTFILIGLVAKVITLKITLRSPSL